MTTPMTVSAESRFVAAPRISRERFTEVLRRAGSPWTNQAGEIYDLIAGNGHDPAVWLTICGREHRYGTAQDSVLHRSRTNSWTNARSVRTPGMAHEIIVDPVRGGPYVRYRSVLDSVRDGMARIDDPEYVYRRRGATSIRDVLEIWTEHDAEDYVRFVVQAMNGWLGGTPYDEIFPWLVDIRAQLARREPETGVNAGPFEQVPLDHKRGLVVHYSGPVIERRVETLRTLQIEARYHVGKNWAGGGQPTLYGDGLMYHLAVGDAGTVYLCRDLEDMLWHCGDREWNRRSLAVHLPLGGQQRATTEQLLALTAIADRWREFSGTPLAEVRGHGEITATGCPGTLLDEWVRPYRDGAAPGVEGRYFPETGHFVGGAFWRFWNERGGLPIFGYPLSEERQEQVEDGSVRTVQYFERAVFEWHPEKPEPYKVLLRRLGAEALARG